jgi:hypothetical protein
MKFTTNIGMILLAAYLILVGITMFVPGFAIPSFVFGALAIAAGVFILIGR